ncbi:MAG: dioxygenase [Neisseria sp.]|nr:dioxygenase [Neisseria sp.]
MLEIKDLLKGEGAGAIQETLDFMLYECSLDEAPSATDVAEWRDILTARGGKFSRYAEICSQWLAEEAQREAE